ncbi:Alanine racemase 1 [Austwickia sp. TVS 96-490-7B]|uniref:alanine racemase n=1 Tax=Austwickia sp. TVS 96-490-7B TaxID=2830843 RepID=UPI001C5A2C81|nr:alanine racemase [Austwickia sp. TVS 96-490-7B]MBW3084317.1 Alanine racemase 1 [Austwickia sp. TVS 96-490-7B]
MLYQTCVQVHLDAIGHNLTAIRERVGPDRLILAAVKADAYGHGAVAVSRHVQAHGYADMLGVATVPEGLELRQAGITLPILKLSHVFPAEAATAVACDLTVAVVDVESARVVQEAAAQLAAARPDEPVRRTRVHVKVDTGMRRIGCEPEQAPELAAWVEQECPHVELEGIFTHLPVSDTPSQDDFTAEQLARFGECRAEVEAALGGRRLIAHAANSGGVLAHPNAWLDMVRPGVMVYGSYPDPDVPHTVPLRPALTWQSLVSFVKDVPAGETVGYGRTWSSPAPARIATVPVGYGDGYDRRSSNRGQVLIDGCRYPIVGRVCMDQLMVDVTDAPPGRPVQVGHRVILIGQDGAEQLSAAELAAELDTIPYEVTCRIAPRVTRLYGDA